MVQDVQEGENYVCLWRAEKNWREEKDQMLERVRTAGKVTLGFFL